MHLLIPENMKNIIPFIWAILFFMGIDVNAGSFLEVPGGEILAKTDLQIPQRSKSASILIPLAVGFSFVFGVPTGPNGNLSLSQMLHSPAPEQVPQKAELPLAGPPGLIKQTAKRLFASFALFLAISLPDNKARGQITTTMTDDFSSDSYAVGSGWLGAWIDEESGAATPTTGNIRVESGRVRLYPAILGGGGLYRDFSVAHSALTVRTLTFNDAGNTGNDSQAPSDVLIVEFSSNGGAGHTTLASLDRNLTTTGSSGTINLPGITGPGSYRIRFRNSEGAQVATNLSAIAGVADGAGAVAPGSSVVSAAISTAGNLIKNDAGITTLSGANTYV